MNKNTNTRKVELRQLQEYQLDFSKCERFDDAGVLFGDGLYA